MVLDLPNHHQPTSAHPHILYITAQRNTRISIHVAVKRIEQF